jgi:hypothetical protein
MEGTSMTEFSNETIAAALALLAAFHDTKATEENIKAIRQAKAEAEAALEKQAADNAKIHDEREAKVAAGEKALAREARELETKTRHYSELMQRYETAKQFHDEYLMPLLNEIGIREMPYSVPVDGSSNMSQRNEHFMTIIDQVRRAFGRPSEAEERQQAMARWDVPELVIVPMGGSATGTRAVEVAHPRKRRDSHA